MHACVHAPALLRPLYPALCIRSPAGCSTCNCAHAAPPPLLYPPCRPTWHHMALLAPLCRWEAGPYSDPGKGGLKQPRQLQVPLVLAPGDTEALAGLYADALDLVASTSLGPAAIRGAALSRREERALKWTQGAMARAVAQREARLQQFALTVRSAATRLRNGRPAGRRWRTEDVVKDTPLPEFKIDLSLLVAALRPNRCAGRAVGLHIKAAERGWLAACFACDCCGRLLLRVTALWLTETSACSFCQAFLD